MQIIKVKNSKNKNKQNFKRTIDWKWCVKILFFSFALSLSFSVLSETALNGASVALSIFIIIVLMLLNIFFDMIGVAVTAGKKEPFVEMQSREVKGASESLLILNHAEKVSVFCCDIIGDICGILCGAAGAVIVLKIIQSSANTTLTVLISAFISSIIACLMIFGKSIEKGYALHNANKIVLKLGKSISFWVKK